MPSDTRPADVPRRPLRAPRWPWRSLLVLAVAFLLLGAAGDGGVSTLIALGGFVLSMLAAAMGYGMTRQKVEEVKDSTKLAHERISDVKDDIGVKIDRLTGSFTELRVDLAEAGVLKKRRGDT